MESLSGAHSPVGVNYNLDYRNVIDARFLRASFERELDRDACVGRVVTGRCAR